jgi:hypothetical protein
VLLPNHCPTTRDFSSLSPCVPKCCRQKVNSIASNHSNSCCSEGSSRSIEIVTEEVSRSSAVMDRTTRFPFCGVFRTEQIEVFKISRVNRLARELGEVQRVRNTELLDNSRDIASRRPTRNPRDRIFVTASHQPQQWPRGHSITRQIRGKVLFGNLFAMMHNGIGTVDTLPGYFS